LRRERQLAAQERTLEGKLRQAQFEAGQLAMMKVAHEDEIQALEHQVLEQTELAAARERELQAAHASLEERTGAALDLDEVIAKAQAAEEARREMAHELASHREKHETLLQRLLAEQRAKLVEEVHKLQRQLSLSSSEQGSALQALKEQVSAEAAAKAKEERVETLRRQSLRRIKNKDLAAGWAAWLARWEAKAYALSRLRECGNKLHTPELSVAFGVWSEWWRALKLSQLESQYSAGNDAYAALQAELATSRRELEEVSRDRQAMRDKVTELDGGVTEAARLREQAEVAAKEERVELLRRQSMRRVLNRDLANGWSAWHELWTAKVYAMSRLRETGQKLKSPALADAFGFWSTASAEEKQEGEYLRLAQKAAGLDGERTSLTEELARVTQMYEQQLKDLEERRQRDLERQLVALTGSAEEQAAMLAEKAREERVEMLRRQSMRRMLNASLAGAWSAWFDMWEAKTYAMGRLRDCGNRLHAPEKTRVFTLWKDEWRGELNAAELSALAAKAAGLDGERTSLAEEMAQLREELRRTVEAAAEDKRVALARLTTELCGTADEVQAMRAEKEKEERVELLRRQSMRRVLNRDLANGWSAWHELWTAKVYALKKLQSVGNQLRAPEKLEAFAHWQGDLADTRRAAELAEMQAQASSLDTQLRRAKAELTNLKMVKTAREDEIAELKSKLREAIEDRTAALSAKAAAIGESGDLNELKARVEALTTHLAEAERRVREAEEEGAKQRAHHESLLERLLAEQRSRFEADLGQTEAQHQEQGDEQRAAFAELAGKLEAKEKEYLDATLEVVRCKELMAKMKQESECERAELLQQMRREQEQMEQAFKTETAILKREVKEYKDREERRKVTKRGASPMRIQLDEGPNALPVATQIAAHLRANAARVLDLFREWDQDNDGVVSREEFHKAMPKLGLVVSESFTNELFDKWDEGGDGALQYHDLQKVLRRTNNPATPKIKTAARALAAFGGTLPPSSMPLRPA